MQITPASRLACPIDGLPLLAHGPSLRCDGGHSFDRAREGYWNLLLVQHKASRDPGDGKDMVAARRRFLDAGHFEPIAQRVFDVVRALGAEMNRAETGGGGSMCIADAGCGEGYYLDQLARSASASTDAAMSGSWRLNLAGYDVSKWAVQAAARRKVPVTWVVANSRTPPFPAGSVDVLLCLFGFAVWDGFKSVQAPGGRVVLVDPGPDHLLELREVIYPTVTRSGPPSLTQAEAAGYLLENEQTLRFSMELPSAQSIQDLVTMTPHAYRMTERGRDALGLLDTLTVTADVVVRTLQLG